MVLVIAWMVCVFLPGKSHRQRTSFSPCGLACVWPLGQEQRATPELPSPFPAASAEVSAAPPSPAASAQTAAQWSTPSLPPR